MRAKEVKAAPATDPFEVQLRIAEEHQQAGRSADAERMYRKVLAPSPDHARAQLGLGLLLHQLGRDEEACEHLQAAAKALPQNLDARYSLGVSLARLRRHAEAAQQFETALRHHAGVADVHNYLGIELAELGRTREAERHLLRAIRLKPTLAEAHKNLGTLLSELGRLPEARAALRKAIAHRPDYARAWWHLASITTFTAEHAAELRAMQALYERPGLPDAQRVDLAFALGKASHDLGEHERAFAYWRDGNETRRRLTPYRLRPALAEMRAVERLFSADFCRPFFASAPSGPRPLFIVGMPRSGTSLVEQILASHSAVYGAGELATLDALLREAAGEFPAGLAKLDAAGWKSIGERYLGELASMCGEAQVVTDKMPGNFLHIGAIWRMFPAARIIHCVRDPMDTGLSCYRSHFVSDQLGYTCDLLDLGSYFRHYRSLMAHWHRVAAGPLYDIRYEALVAEPEAEVRRLLEFCGLTFEPGCLQFHRSSRRVRTASGAQVRQPIYKDSLAGWRRYERELRPLAAALAGPWAERRARLRRVLTRR